MDWKLIFSWNLWSKHEGRSKSHRSRNVIGYLLAPALQYCILKMLNALDLDENRYVERPVFCPIYEEWGCILRILRKRVSGSKMWPWQRIIVINSVRQLALWKAWLQDYTKMMRSNPHKWCAATLTNINRNFGAFTVVGSLCSITDS
jgi:hypothetical protein